MSTAEQSPARPPKTSQLSKHPLVAFLGSMELAISLLVAVAIASAIGTILQQNQAYNSYIIKFGPFWFDVFERLGLYDIYSTGWFLGILGFLTLSTSVCVITKWPSMQREMRTWRDDVQRRSLSLFKQQKTWHSGQSSESITSDAARILNQRGYKTRLKEQPEHILLVAKKGALNRVGYLLTHLGIVVICLGGLADSRLPFKAAELLGNLKPEMRNIPASEVPDISRLPVWNPSLRGNVDIPEGSAANLVFIGMRDGYLVQDLPFTIELKTFRITHHITGQPKSFDSDLIIHDDALDEPLEATISVNHPLSYRGYTIYQASFGDGGSKLEASLWPLDQPETAPVALKSAVNQQLDYDYYGTRKKLEFTEFRLFNINPIKDENGKVDQRNYGPSFQFKVREVNGEAREYDNYMAPVNLNGFPVILSGVRSQPSEPFEYLHIPADRQGSVQRFLKLVATLRNADVVRELSKRSVSAAMNGSNLQNNQLESDLIKTMPMLVNRFLDSGLQGILDRIDRDVPEAQRKTVFDAYFKVLQVIVGAAYERVLTEEGISEYGEQEGLWMETAFSTLNGLHRYGSGFYMQLTSFEHIQSSGLQITKSPGKNTVYLGCLMLTLGVFFLFYIHQKRLWLMLYTDDKGMLRCLFAGSDTRRSKEFEREFQQLARGFEAKYSDPPPPSAPNA